MDDIWENILKLVDIPTIHNFYLVDKHFSVILKRETLWQHFYLNMCVDIYFKDNYFTSVKDYYCLKILYNNMIHMNYNDFYDYKNKTVISFNEFIGLDMLSYNGIDNKIFNHLHLMKNLNSIYICRCKLSFIPDEIYELTNLRHLNANYNNIKTFSTNIYLLTKLDYLDLSNNYIQEIPNGIKSLQCIRNLYFRNNCIITFTNEIYELPNLLYLTISDNPIRPNIKQYKFINPNTQIH